MLNARIVAVVGALLPSVACAQFSDDFDSYANGSGLVGQGGWELWYTGGQDATVLDDQAHSAPHSARLTLETDVVQRFNIQDGQWTLTVWTYVPDVVDALEGDTYFIMMNGYGSTTDDNWSLQIQFNQLTDQVVSQQAGTDPFLPIIYDQWVLLQADIDLDADQVDCYYNGQVLFENRTWTNMVSQGGNTSIACIDLYNALVDDNYFDDLSLQPAGGCDDCDGDGTCDEDEADCDANGIPDECDPNFCPADADGNGNLNLFDFLAFQTAFGNEDPCADMDGSGTLNLFDFLAFQTAFGNEC